MRRLKPHALDPSGAAEGDVLKVFSGTPVWGPPPSSSGGGTVETYADAVTALPGRVHRWSFEEASGNSVADAVGGLPITLSGSFTRAVGGLNGTATRFNNASGATAGLGSIPVGGAERCFIVVFRTLADTTAKETFFVYGSPTTRAFFGGDINHSGTIANHQVSTLTWGDDVVLSQVPTADTSWHVAAFGLKGQSTFVYIDGMIAARRLGGLPNTGSSGNFTVGVNETGVAALVGDLDDLIVLNVWPGKHTLDRLYRAAFPA